MNIGVVLPIAEDPQTGIAPAYREIRALAQGAERAGFDSIWLFDHLIYRFPERPVSGPWECWTMLSALAEATERVQLGTIVLCTAFRNPAVLAKMAVTLAAISENRLILGLGAGWHEPEFDAFGLPFDHRAGRFEEAIRTGTPPGGPRMLRLTAEWADSWNTAWFGQPTLMLPRREKLVTACGEVGREPDSLEVTAGVQVAFPDLGDVTMPVADRDKVLTGTAQEIADGLRAYDDLGVGHVIINVAPNTLAAQERLTEALNLYRAGAADS
jgi:alkanesulfonate monooxygenase SsuD/methylene tetrahydromethanopterin reductase-like flavin-dependent oxidoreductase (luciferase family)